MGAPLPLSVTSGQPQQVVRIRERWRKRGLKFAFLPSVGFVNLADGAPALRVSGPLLTSATSSGIAHAGARAEFGAQFTAVKGLTIISIWRSRASSDYLGADGTPTFVSNRTSSNTGWSYGRGVAIGGASNGNLVPQSITFQGNQQYTESSATIESRIDTPVACRYDPVANKISWFRFGTKSSGDTTPTASPSVGGNLVFGAQGDFTNNGGPWIDRDTACIIFDGVLTDAEIAELTATTASVWQAFELSGFSMPMLAALTSAASAGGGTTVTGSLAWTEVNDGSAISATETDHDTIAWTEADDAHSIASAVADLATLGWTEADDTYAALAIETDREAFAWTEPDDVWALTAAAIDRAALAWTEDDDAETLTVSDASPVSVSGAIAWAEQDDALSLVGGIPITGMLGWVEADDGVRITAASVASALLDTHDGGPITRESLKAAKKRAKELERARLDRDARAAADRVELHEAIRSAARKKPAVQAAVRVQKPTARPILPRVDVDEDEEELLLLLM